MAPQDSQICGGNFPKRKKSAAEFVSNISYGYYRDSSNHGAHNFALPPAGMHCPAWGDAGFSSVIFWV